MRLLYFFFIILLFGLEATSVTRSEMRFDYTKIKPNNEIIINFDVGSLGPAGELLFPLGFALQNHIDLQLDSIGGDMSVSIIYPERYIRDLCLILFNKPGCDSLTWNNEFYPGGAFDVVIKNIQNDIFIEINGHIKVKQKDYTFDSLKSASIGLGIFIGGLCLGIFIISMFVVIRRFCIHYKSKKQYSSINE